MHSADQSKCEHSSGDTTNSVIIWTFRRTGGTNLTSAVMELSGGKTVEHEPFNIDRVFGDITAEWLETRDLTKLRPSLEDILSQRISIKHCLEIIPMEMNFLIASLSIKYGYKHLFLFRENAADRLLSLNYAEKTGVWGSKQKKSIQIKKGVFSEPVDVPKLINHELSARANMRSIYDLLIAEGQKPLAASFESLYKSFKQYSMALLNEIFSGLTGDTSLSTVDELHESLVSRGSQGSNSDYMLFPEAHELANQGDKLGTFRLHQKVHCSVTAVDSPNQVVHSELWKPLPCAQADKYYIQGILLYKQDEYSKVNIRQDDRTILAEIGLHSPRIKKKHPEIVGASHCRFFSGPIAPFKETSISIKNLKRDEKRIMQVVLSPTNKKVIDDSSGAQRKTSGTSLEENHRGNLNPRSNSNSRGPKLKLINILNSKLGYFPIPKTACTSIKQTLYRLDLHTDFVSRKGHSIHNYFARRPMAPIDSIEFSFLVIRDPIKRLLSAYSNRVLHYRELSLEFLSSKSPEFVGQVPYCDPTLVQFINHLIEYSMIPNINHHIEPVSERLTSKDLCQFGKIYPIENISSLGADLSTVLGRDVKFDRSQTGGRKIPLGELSLIQMKTLIDYYKEDYQLLSEFYTADKIMEEWAKAKSQ